MRLTEIFTKTKRQKPADEVSRNAQLLIQAGYIHKEMAGVYSYMPLGLQVIENIKAIIREEMNSIGAHELIMTSLQPKELWEQTDRWDDEIVDIWFKTKLKNGTEVGLGWSHEEQITVMMRDFISSYRDLPVYVYQFQNKLRNETRAKSGIMRTREFVMKDLYSYSRNEEEHKRFYDGVTEAYKRIFDRVGLGNDTFFTFASGGAFTQFSHEFQTITEAGEDVIYLDREKKIAVNEEVMSDDIINQLGLSKEKLEKVASAEVGNIFSFGGFKCEQLGLFFDDIDGKSRPVVLGSYGIGVGRLMGVVVERFSDDLGIVWPDNIAPAKAYIIPIGLDDKVKSAAEDLYSELSKEGLKVIYDDRDERPGEKFTDADLLGIPYRIVISEKTLNGSGYELKKRTEKNGELVDREKILSTLK